MAVYRYVGRDVLNRRKRGLIEAENVDAARELLLSRGVVVVEKLSEDKSLFKKSFDVPFLNRITLRDLLIFTRQLYAMIHAGIPLVQALGSSKIRYPIKDSNR